MDSENRAAQERPYWDMKERGDWAGLIAALASDDDDVLTLVTNILAQNGIAEAASAFVPLLSHPSPRVRSVTAMCAGRLAREVTLKGGTPDPVLVEPLVALFSAEKDSNARFALEQYDDPRAKAALGNTYDPLAAQALVDSMHDASLTIGARQAAATDLGKLAEALPACDARDWVVDRLVDASTDEEGPLRYSAVGALGHMADPRCFDALMAALGDTGWMVRGEAADGLGRLRDPRALPALERMTGSPDDNDRFVALRAWRAIRGEA